MRPTVSRLNSAFEIQPPPNPTMTRKKLTSFSLSVQEDIILEISFE